MTNQSWLYLEEYPIVFSRRFITCKGKSLDEYPKRFLNRDTQFDNIHKTWNLASSKPKTAHKSHFKDNKQT